MILYFDDIGLRGVGEPYSSNLERWSCISFGMLCASLRTDKATALLTAYREFLAKLQHIADIVDNNRQNGTRHTSLFRGYSANFDTEMLLLNAVSPPLLFYFIIIVRLPTAAEK